MIDTRSKVWITRYALTDGIFSCLASIERGSYGTPYVSLARNGHCVECFFRDDWHLSYEDAVKRAEKMLQDKIASLKRQIYKLESKGGEWPVKEY